MTLRIVDHEDRAVHRYKRMKFLGQLTWLLWVIAGITLFLALLAAFALGRLTALYG